MMDAAAVAIEPGDARDLSAVMTIMDDSFDAAFGEAWTAAQCAGLLPMHGVWLTLAREQGEAVGFALCRAIADEAELLLLAVRRGRQGRGVGRLLLDAFARSAGVRGARRLHLEVRDGNPAVRLYVSAGYCEVGRRSNYYSGRGGRHFDALTLAKKTES